MKENFNPFLENLYYFKDHLKYEFYEIQKNSRKNTSVLLEKNKNKNRYIDTIPFAENIVKLNKKAYINASFISYSNCQQKYIATQAPLKNTTNDFWEMIFEQKTEFIVMLCNPFPGKCHVYWPSIQSKLNTGNLTIKTLSLTETISLDKRKIMIVDNVKKQKRILLHLHYKEWDDSAIPENKETLGLLLEQIPNKPTNTPIVVHCSAGCGRTGTLCAIDTIRKINVENHVDDLVFNIVSAFREQRPLMVQTCLQYVFIVDFIGFYLYNKEI